MMFAAFEPSWLQLAAVFGITLVGDVFGSLIGGGGFIIHPVLLMLGIPAPIALANDMAASGGAAISGGYVFHRHKLINYHLLLWWLPGLLLGPVIGVKLLVLSPDWLLRWLVAANAVAGALLLVRIISRPPQSKDGALPRGWQFYSVIFGFLIGIYFGYGGAGAGVLASALLIGVLRTELRHTVGLKNIITFVPALPASVSYFWHGLLSPPLLAAMIAASLLGGYLGGRIVVTLPNRILQRLFLGCVVTVVALLLLG